MTPVQREFTMKLNLAMGKYLEELRLSRGIGRAEMAEYLGLSYGALTNREIGKASTTINDLISYSNYFGIYPSDIVSIVEQSILNG